MKTRTTRTYICDVCGQEFDSESEAESHEARCYGLSDQEYQTWFHLSDRAARSGKLLSIQSNPETRKRFDTACEKLAAFEAEHRLESVRKPSDWYL